MLQRVMSRFFVENILSHTTKTLRRGTLLCCVSEKFLLPKSFWMRGWGKYQDLLSKTFCRTVSKNAVEEPFSLSLSSGIEKLRIVELGEGGESQDFQSKLFCLKVPKHFVEEPFYGMFQKISGSKNVFGLERGGNIKISFEKFLSHSAEKIRRWTLQGVSGCGYRKMLCFRGLCHDFPSKFFCLTAPKRSVEESFYAVYQKVSGSGKVYG